MTPPRADIRTLAASPSSHAMSRRGFLAGSLAAFFAAPLSGCSGDDDPTGPAMDARLQARPGSPTGTPTQGESALGLEAERDGLLYVSEPYDASAPAPMLVLLHGAGGQAADWRTVFPVAGDRGLVALALDSRGVTWDRVRGDFGADVGFMDAALDFTFQRCAVDPSRILLAGYDVTYEEFTGGHTVPAGIFDSALDWFLG